MAEPPSPRRSLSDSLEERPLTARSRFSWAGIKQRLQSAAIGGSSADADSWTLEELPANFFGLEAHDAKGAAYPLSQHAGQVVLVANVASF